MAIIAERTIIFILRYSNIAYYKIRIRHHARRADFIERRRARASDLALSRASFKVARAESMAFTVSD